MTRRSPVAAGAAAVAALVAVAGLAGCTSSGPGKGTTSPPATLASPPTSAAPSIPPVSPLPASTAPSTATTSASTASSSAAPPPVQPPAPRSTCRSVGIRVLRGGASAGQEIAALQFTNTGSASCVLVGYPTATLLRNGQPIGKPAEPSSAATSQRTLAPGGVAESLLHDYTLNCQAPLSDAIEVTVPGSSIRQTRPQFQMRGCLLRVDRLGPPE